MKSLYERAKLRLTEFDKEDVIAASDPAPTEPPTVASDVDNAYGAYGRFNYDNAPGSWF